MRKILSILVATILIPSFLYAGTATVGRIGKQDLKLWDGTSQKTFERKSRYGGYDVLNKIGYTVDALSVYGGGTEYTCETIANTFSNIGKTAKVGVKLAPGTWIISSTRDFSAYENITLIIPDGAQVRCDADLTLGGPVIARPDAFTDNGGTADLTINGPFEAGNYKVFDWTGSGSVIFGQGAVEKSYSEWWGGVADGVYAAAEYTGTDSTSAIKKAVASIASIGGTVQLLNGAYIVSDGMDISDHGVILRGASETNATGGETSGTTIALNTTITDSIINIVSDARGVEIEDIAFYGQNRTVTCEAAIHVEDGYQVKLNRLRFRRIAGSAIRMSNSVKPFVSNIDIDECGDTSDPSFTLVTQGGTDIVQGGHFAHMNIESAYGDIAGLFVGDGNVANKFLDLTFENADLATDPYQLQVDGDRNIFSIASFQRGYNTTAKVYITGQGNTFSSLYFREPANGGAELYLHTTANDNNFSALNFYNQGITPNTAKIIDCRGSRNIFDAINSYDSGGFNVAGFGNSFGKVKLYTCDEQSLVCSGAQNSFADWEDVDSAYTGASALYLFSGADNEADSIKITNPACTGYGISITGGNNRIYNSKVEKLDSGTSAIVIDANWVSIIGCEIREVQENGILVEDGRAGTILAMNRLTFVGEKTATTYRGIYFNSAGATEVTYGSQVIGNMVTNSDLAASIECTDDGAGNEDWIANVTGNICTDVVTWLTARGSTVSNTIVP